MAKKKDKKVEPKKETSEKTRCRLRSYLTLKNVVVGIIVLLFLSQYFQIRSVVGDTSELFGRDSSLITEIGQLKEAYGTFGDDLAEIREYFGMPASDYMAFEEPKNAEETDGVNENRLQLALFQYVDYLSSRENLDKKILENKSFLDVMINSEDFSSFLTEQELTISAVSESDDDFSVAVNTTDLDGFIFLSLSKEDGALSFKTINSIEQIESENSDDFINTVTEFIKTNKDKIVDIYGLINNKTKEIEATINSDEIQTELTNLNLSLSSEHIYNNFKYTYSVLNKLDVLVGEIILDTVTLEISLIDTNNTSLSVKSTDISVALLPFLQKLNSKTFVEKKADEALASLTSTLEDEGFKLLLSNAGLSISAEPREYDGRIFYDIFDSEGEKISSLVVETATGVINIVDPDGNNSENLLFFDPEFKKKTLEIPENIPEYSDEASNEENTFNILISGKNGNLIDTMIFAHVNEETRKIRMISIPRDLFYNGRKINSFAYFYGMPELTRVLSDITGYELDKYILVDMYAFIDVIDILGGIDIHLDQPVIDPTYRTVDDGVEGTLYYEPGDYHLGGVEALRLARSRHTSSDFARAERQQLILKALQNKARNFGFGDASTIYEIAKTVLAKTETNIGLDEAIMFYFKYQDYEIESNVVMSSGNVLYVPPYITAEDCSRMISAAGAAGAPRPDCENANQAYTLLPKDNNWNVVKWFFRENFEAI